MSARSAGSSERMPTRTTRSGSTAGSVEPVVRERIAREAERGRERHPVDVSRRARGRRVEVAVRVDPDHAARLARGRAQAGERPERDRVVAAEDERDRAVGDDVARRCRRAARTPRGSRAGTARARPRRRAPRARASSTLPRSTTRQPNDDEPLLEPRVADRRRAHVDAAPALAEVERRPDDRHGLRRRGHGAGGYTVARATRVAAEGRLCRPGGQVRQARHGDKEGLVGDHGFRTPSLHSAPEAR